MSYSSMLLVQPLYDAQKQIDTLYKKYKTNVLEYNSSPSPDGNAPKNAVIQYYTNMVDALNKYNIIKASIVNEKAIAVRQIVGLKVILKLILTIAVVIILLIVGFEFVKMFNNISTIFDIYTKTEIITNIYFFIVTLIIYSVLNSIVINPFVDSYMTKYDKIYNTNVFANSFAIKSIIDMMDIDTTNVKRSSNGEVTIGKKGSSSNPMMMWWLTKLKSLSLTFDYKPNTVSVQAIKDQYCADKSQGVTTEESTEGVVGKEIDICSTENKCIDGYVSNIKVDGKVNRETIMALYTPCDIGNHVQPFHTIEVDDIHSSKYLLKEIQSYDKYDQINRLNKSMSYLKGLVLRKNDEDYQKITPEEKKTLESEIISKLQISYLIIRNLSIPYEHSYEIKNISLNESIKLCLDDDECCGFIYKGGVAYIIKKYHNIVFSYMEEQNDDNIAFIKKDINTTAEIYSIREPTIDNINKLFNYNVENVDKLSMYSYCVTNYSKTCLNSTIFKAERDIGYDDLFKINSGIDSVLFYTYKTEFESIKNNNFKNNIKDTILYIKTYLIQQIKDLVSKADPSYGFRLVEDDVTLKIKDFYGDDWLTVSSIMLDIINESNNEIITAQKATNVDEFITFEKFSSKLAVLKQDVFLSKYIFNIDEIRFTSKSLYNLYKMYDYKQYTENNVNNTLISLFYVALGLGCIEFLRFCYNGYMDFKESDRNKYPIYYEAEDNGTTIVKWKFKKNDVKIIDAGTENSNDKYKNNYYNSFSELLVKYSIFFLMFVFLISFFYAWVVKRREVYAFNTLISESNGDIIRNESNEIFSDYVTLLNEKSLFPLKNGFVIGDTILDDMKIEYIIQNSEASVDKEIILGTFDLQPHYEKIKRIITSYDKCNYLLDGDIESVPFPALEFIMYLFLLIVALVAIIYMFHVIKPFEKLELVKILFGIRRILKNGGNLSDIDESILEDVDINTSTVTKLMLFILVVIAALFVGILLYANTNSFKSSLYTSDLFRDRNCYSVT
jgi:hypothetical protein